MHLVRALITVSFLLIFHIASEKMDGNEIWQNTTKIRVINKSKHVFTGVSMFSMKFKDLKPGDTSEYKILSYKPLKDDPLIYCVKNGKNFGRYLKIPDSNVVKFTYSIDSLKQDIIYVSSNVDEFIAKN